MIALRGQLTMQTLKDRLVGLLSSPTETKFEKIEDYDNDNLPWFKHVASETMFYIDAKNLNEILLPYIAAIVLETNRLTIHYFMPMNGYMPKSNNVLIKGKHDTNRITYIPVTQLIALTDIIRDIDELNVDATGKYDYMTFVKQCQVHLESNYQAIKQLSYPYYVPAN